ncbi:MAG: NADH-quinone oxidoreductase subunit A [Methylophilaceae bacterium]|nr:NADH-quinone oxidoreductase subunit A [Methylophilaceae bacterium]
MLENYFPILLFICVGLAVGAGPLLIGSILSPLVAILFILFDLEITFLFPWAVVIQKIGMFGFIAMMIFLAILVVGFIYEWMKGALDWE